MVEVESYSLKLKEKTALSSVLDSLEANGSLSSSMGFHILSRVFPVDSVPAGCYKIHRGMGSKDIFKKLKNGQQDAINFTLSTATFLSDIASRAGQRFMFDSSSLMQFILADSNQKKMGYNAENALCLFLPNTHEYYWNSSMEKFTAKFYKDYQEFWSEERKEKASRWGLTQNEVYVMASLVQKEYTMKDERSKIAGVLMNRLKKSMPLQVDATCKYATGDFAAKRVLSYHTTYPSPYNTYLHYGLPPGPICVPEISTIDAILDAEIHSYFYYCADPSLNGYHVFTSTLAEHASIASKYHQRMNELMMK